MQLRRDEEERRQLWAIEKARVEAEAERVRLEAEEKARRDAAPVMITLDHLTHYKVTEDDAHHLDSGKLFFSPRSTKAMEKLGIDAKEILPMSSHHVAADLDELAAHGTLAATRHAIKTQHVDVRRRRLLVEACSKRSTILHDIEVAKTHIDPTEAFSAAHAQRMEAKARRELMLFAQRALQNKTNYAQRVMKEVRSDATLKAAGRRKGEMNDCVSERQRRRRDERAQKQEEMAALRLRRKEEEEARRREAFMKTEQQAMRVAADYQQQGLSRANENREWMLRTRDMARREQTEHDAVALARKQIREAKQESASQRRIRLMEARRLVSAPLRHKRQRAHARWMDLLAERDANKERLRETIRQKLLDAEHKYNAMNQLKREGRGMPSTLKRPSSSQGLGVTAGTNSVHRIGVGSGQQRPVGEGSLSGSSSSTVLPKIVRGPPPPAGPSGPSGPSGSWAHDSLEGFESLGSAVEACEQHLAHLNEVQHALLRDRKQRRREGQPVPVDDVEEIMMEKARTKFDMALLYISEGSRESLVKSRACCEDALDTFVEDQKYAIEDFDLVVRILTTVANVCKQLGDEEATANYQNEANNIWLDNLSGGGGAVKQDTDVIKWEVGANDVSEEERRLLV